MRRRRLLVSSAQAAARAPAAFVKVDTDIAFEMPFPFDLGPALLATARPVGMRTSAPVPVLIAHTGMRTDDADRWNKLAPCHRGIHAALTEFGRRDGRVARSTVATSARSRHSSAITTTGNFVAFSTRFVRSPRVQALATHLFHNGLGYFRHRWTARRRTWPSCAARVRGRVARRRHHGGRGLAGMAAHGLRGKIFWHVRDAPFGRRRSRAALKISRTANGAARRRGGAADGESDCFKSSRKGLRDDAELARGNRLYPRGVAWFPHELH